MKETNVSITKTENGYTVQDRTFCMATGVVISYHYWLSYWTNDLKLIKIIYNFTSYDEHPVNMDDGIDYTNINKENRDYHRTRLAIGRHLKAIKLQNGDIKEKEKTKKSFIWSYRGIGTLDIDEFVETPNMLGDLRKGSIDYADATDENIKLMKEYNELVEKINKLHKKLFNKR